MFLAPTAMLDRVGSRLCYAATGERRQEGLDSTPLDNRQLWAEGRYTVG